MTPEDIKALRTELKCTARELAAALSIEQAMVLKWEAAELFPTKKHVDMMAKLREQGPSAIPRKARGAQASPMKVLADPALWELVRKLLTHKKLRDDVTKLAAAYADPAEEGLASPSVSELDEDIHHRIHEDDGRVVLHASEKVRRNAAR